MVDTFPVGFIEEFLYRIFFWVSITFVEQLLKLTFCFLGVEFGARMINIDGKQIKLQIWDTVSCVPVWLTELLHTVHTLS